MGALAVALGVGVAVAGAPGVAWADTPPNQASSPPDTSSADASPHQEPSGQSPSDARREDTGANGDAAGDTTRMTAATSGSQATTTLGGGDTPKVTISSSTVDLSADTGVKRLLDAQQSEAASNT